MPSSVIATVVQAVVGYAFQTLVKSFQGGSVAPVTGFKVEAKAVDRVVRSAVSNRTVVYGRAMVSGPLVFAASPDADNSVLYLVIPLASHEIDAVETIYFNDVELGTLDGSGNVTTGTYTGYARITKHLGTSGDPADAALVAANVGWTSAHKLTGVAYLVVRLSFSADIYPTGIPNVKAIIRGKKLYDPRTGLSTWSQNPALAVRDYLTSSYGLGATSAEIDDTMVAAAANVCDEVVTVASGTEARYTCNGVIDLGDTPRNIMETMLTSMVGQVVWAAGKYLVHAGAYTAPTVTLTADDLRGDIRVRPRISRRDLFNAVRGTYVDPAAFWQSTDYPTVSNATYAVNDGGQVIWRDMPLPFTTSSATAQRIAKIMLERSRQGITIEMPAKLTAFKLATYDTVRVTLSQLGWSAKEFKVLSWTLAPEGGVDLVLQEEVAASYNWNSGMETVVDPAPDTNLTDPFVIEAPGGPTVTEQIYQTTGSAGVKSKATVTWLAVADAFVVGYVLEYKPATATDWTVLPMAADTSAELQDLAPATYQFRLRAVNTYGVKSAYSPTTTLEVLGLIAPPANVVNFSITKVGGVAMGAWDLTTDLDVRIGGRVVVRHSPQTTGATWQDGVVLDEFAGDSTSGLLPLITGTYLVKFKDSSGSFSTTAASFVATEGMVTGFTTVATNTQSPTFPGTKTGVAAVSGQLLLDTVATFDSVGGLFDAAPGLFDSYGGFATAGTYLFDTYTDMGTVATRRIEADIKVLSFDSLDLFDSRPGLFDDAPGDFDGTAINDCDATLYYATTNDNPVGSPTWGPWTPFFVADITARAVKFKLDLVSGVSTHNIAVSTLAVDIKTPV